MRKGVDTDTASEIFDNRFWIQIHSESSFGFSDKVHSVEW